jgi:phospholipid-translocating ATPase
MVFRQCTIGGKVYGNSMPTDTGGHPVEPSDSGSSGAKTLSNRFHDSQLERDLEKHDTEQSRMLHGFFAVLGLCHTVLAAEMEPGVIEYKAQSPDEAALVQTAADVGFVFRGRDKNILRLSTPFSDEPDEYELLNILEFTSARKRMSVIVRKLDEEGRIFLLSKGADNVIFDHLIKDESQSTLRTKTDKDLQYFASEGLRTLCLAYRVLDPKYYDQWAKEYHNATVALEDRETRIEEVSEQIENELVLLGATAIEDKLQDGVPECISDLKRAGIKVWVATGDKLETAVAIGYTTHLLTNETNLIIVREGRHTIKDQLLDALEGFFGEHELAREISRTSIDSRPGLARINTGARSLAGEDNGKRPGGFSLVIEGGALTHAFAEPDTHDLLLALSTRCNTVICCRVSPLQKAQIVRLIKNNLGVMCLAIGDGANDVSMIQAADVGVGISGEEGLQAVNSSDYAIAQFRYLRRLLFLHGHWSYFRNSGMILNFFYKNMIGVAVLFWFQPFCGFSTTYVLSYTYLLFWNVFWTLVPVLAIGLFDRNVDERTLMTVPELYGISRLSNYFTLKRFSYYLWEGVLQAAIIYFFLQYTYVTTSTRGDGYDVYIYEMSTTMAIAAVMVANLFTGLNIFTWVGWTYFGIALGIFLVWVYTAVFSSIPPSSFVTGVYGNQVFLFRSYAFWFGVIFATLLALLPRYILRYFKQNYFPDDLDVMRLVRKYHSDADPATHPLLGGKFHERTAKQAESAGTPTQSTPDVIPMEPMEPVPSKMEEGEGKAPLARKLFKTHSNATSKMGRHPSARGSAVDSEFQMHVGRVRLISSVDWPDKRSVSWFRLYHGGRRRGSAADAVPPIQRLVPSRKQVSTGHLFPRAHEQVDFQSIWHRQDS